MCVVECVQSTEGFLARCYLFPPQLVALPSTKAERTQLRLEAVEALGQVHGGHVRFEKFVKKQKTQHFIFGE